jgi:hypothetical protein
MKYLQYGLSCIVLIILCGVIVFNLYSDSTTIGSVTVHGTEIRVEVADTVSTRTQGLSGRETLPENMGMLFVFDVSGVYGFWMKDMLFPIDIIWIDKNKTVVHIRKGVSPDTYPSSFSSMKKALYVLEIKAHLSDELNIREGDVIEINIL